VDDRRTLTEAEQTRALDALRALERAAMFTPDDERVTMLVAEWSFAVRLGSLSAADVAAIAAELERWGIERPEPGRAPLTRGWRRAA
jgi:hypothetical protein